MENNLDFTGLLPIEVIEEIFKNLSSKDLVRCSLVCVKWRELVNNNRIWAKICQSEGIYEKEPLEVSNSLIPNPTKKFRKVPNTCEKFSEICHWRSHYDRYKFLERNWKKGHCALHQLDVTSHVYPTYFSDGLMVILLGDILEIFMVTGRLHPSLFCRVKLEFPDRPVDTILVSRHLIVYSQVRKIFGLRANQEEFVQDFVIDVKCERSESNDNLNSNQNELIVKKTENYLVVVDVLRPSKIFIWNTTTGTLEKEVELEKSKTNQIASYCLEVHSLKVYVAYSIGRCHYVAEYDIESGEWGGRFGCPFRVAELYVTSEMLVAKVEKRPDEDFELCVRSLSDRAEVANIPVGGDKPIVLTDDAVLYCSNNTVNVHSLREAAFQSKFSVPADLIVNMFPVGKHLLVLNTGDAIEIWDWGTGEKLYTPYRGLCSNSMWVNDTTIVISRWSCNYQIISYW